MQRRLDIRDHSRPIAESPTPRHISRAGSSLPASPDKELWSLRGALLLHRLAQGALVSGYQPLPTSPVTQDPPISPPQTHQPTHT